MHPCTRCHGSRHVLVEGAHELSLKMLDELLYIEHELKRAEGAFALLQSEGLRVDTPDTVGKYRE